MWWTTREGNKSIDLGTILFAKELEMFFVRKGNLSPRVFFTKDRLQRLLKRKRE
jgi:hypothetical protein